MSATPTPVTTDPADAAAIRARIATIPRCPTCGHKPLGEPHTPGDSDCRLLTEERNTAHRIA